MQASSSYDLQESDIQQQRPRGHPVQESVASGSRPDSVDSSELKGADLDARARAERTKAKNKRAQKKFRQKQKEKHEELERSAAELSERLKNTTAELDALQNQKRVLEIALSRNIDPQESAASTSQVCLKGNGIDLLPAIHFSSWFWHKADHAQDSPAPLLTLAVSRRAISLQ